VWCGVYCLLRTTHTPNQELHMRPHLPRFYHNNTLLIVFYRLMIHDCRRHDL